MKLFKGLQVNALITSIVYIALGLLFVIVPSVVTRTVAVILGVLMALAGIVYIIQYFRKWDIEYKSNGLAIGILLIFGALFLLLQSNIVAAIIPLFLGLAVVLSGTIKMQNAIVLYKARERLWIPTIILSALCFILGIIIMVDPFATLEALIVLIGVSLLISGITDLVIIFIMSRRAKQINAVK